MADPSDASRLRFGREGRPVVRAIAYDGRFGPLARIIVSNALLSLVTLGVYRFWGKTRLRRYLWSHVVVDGERLEYTGQAMELLLGFAVAITVLLLLGFAGLAINLAVAQMMGIEVPDTVLSKADVIQREMPAFVIP